jgi:hypothetical protein
LAKELFFIYFVFQSSFKMNTQPIEQLNEIREMMQRSTRFISLSGLSGVFAGIIAILGAAFAFFYLNYDLRYFEPESYFNPDIIIFEASTFFVLILDAILVFVLALSFAIYFSAVKARKSGQKLWSYTTRQLLVNISIPLVAGGLFCLALLWHGIIYLIAPATLIFYGLALIYAGKYTLGEIKWLGISEATIGIIAAFIPGYGLFAWSVGFGLLHVVYGIIMYFRYDRNN